MSNAQNLETVTKVPSLVARDLWITVTWWRINCLLTRIQFFKTLR